MSDINGDQYTYLDSTASSNNEPVFTSKQWAYQIDQNNGSYGSKQIIFDLSGFYNSQRFINPKEMFIVMPVVSTMTSLNDNIAAALGGLGIGPKLSTDVAHMFNDNGAQVTNQFAMGYKSGYWHLISSIQIQVDGKDVIQLTPEIGYHASFVANTTWSETDVKKHGALVGFYPDTATSWSCNGAGAASDIGYGICNNVLPPAKKFKPYPLTGNSKLTDAIKIAIGGGGETAQFYPQDGCSQYNEQFGVNHGFMERMKFTNKYDAVSFINNLPALSHTARMIQAAGNHTCIDAETKAMCESKLISQSMDLNITDAVNSACSDSNSTTAFRQLQTTCVIRFKDVCDLFTKLPLTRGLYMRVIINLNTGNLIVGASCALTLPTDAPIPTALNFGPIYSKINSNTFPGTCPLMLAPMVVSALNRHALATNVAATNIGIPGDAVFTGEFPTDSNIQLYPGVAVDAGTVHRKALIVSVSIATPDPIHVQNGLATPPPSASLLNCRIYAPIIDMEPTLTNSYITQHKEQAVYYRDVLRFVQPNVAAGTPFTFQVANGVVNAKRMVMIPFYHDDTSTASASGSYPNMERVPFQPISPFDSAPATTAPQWALQDFNVLISNINVFQRAVTYSFENFITEIQGCNSLNGALDIGLQSGLIDKTSWENNYRYYVVDLSRRLAGDNTPKSITVVGTSKSLFPVDIWYFIEYERHLSLDVESGHISVSSN